MSNTEHRRSSIVFMTPADVHYGWAMQILQIRSATLDAAFEAHPQRFNLETAVDRFETIATI